jgi:ribosomal protein S7
MKNGKRGSAERMLFQCCAFIKNEKTKEKKTASRRSIHQAVHNVKPLIELRNLRTKGSRRRKAKAAPIPTLRSEKLAIQ